MKHSQRFRGAVALFVISVLTLLSYPALAAQKDPKKDSKESKEEAPQGTPVLWKEPTDIASRNLLLGPGGEGMKPDLSQVVWDGQEGVPGYSVKWKVRDGAGKKWAVKLGREAQPETVAVRLVWAAGYVTEVNYLVPCVHIVNAPKPPKKVERCEGDGFANVRFEARPKGVKRLDDPWKWKENPFVGMHQLEGLKGLMALLNNWDLKDSNNVIIYAPNGRRRGELRYVISDLGATFGRTGSVPVFWRITRSRNNPEDYA